MIKAVVFDIGGVIIDLDYEKAVNSFREKAGFVTIGEYLDLWRQRGFFEQLEAGAMSEEEFVTLCLAQCRPGTRPEVLQECLDDFLVGIDPRKVEIIRALSEKYPLYLLSNNNPISMRGCEKMFADAGIPMDRYFRKRFISSEMKMVKPEPPIYLAAIEAIGCRPEEILFIDDSQKNVDGARAVGIDARKCTTLDSFCSTLKEFL